MEPMPAGLEQIFSDVGVSYLEAVVEDDPRNFIKRLYRSSIMASRAGNVARVVTSSIAVVEGRVPKANEHFLDGEMIGLNLIRHFSGNQHQVLASLHNNLARAPLINLGQRQSEDEVKLTPKAMVNMANYGWERAKADYDRLFTYWDSEICDKPVHRPYFRQGFGLVLAGAVELNQLEIEEMADQVLTNTDFDVELRYLLQEPRD